MNPDLSRLRLQPGDRARHCDGREATIVSIEGDNDGLLFWVVCDLDEGGTIREPMGAFEKIPTSKLTA